MKKQLLSLVSLCGVACLPCLSTAQVIVNETFDYPTLAALQANWGALSGLGLDTAGGQPAPSGTHNGAAQAHVWVGSTFSIIPTDANPLVLTADIWDSGAGNQRNTIGLRGGPFPLFEMGMYNSFNHPTAGSGEGVRVASFAGNENWHQMGLYTNAWSRWEATFTTYSVAVRVDTGIDNTWDLVWTSTGATPIGAFSNLRFGGPSASSSAGGGFAVDNIRLEVVPEPSSLALGVLGGLTLLAASRRRGSV